MKKEGDDGEDTVLSSGREWGVVLVGGWPENRRLGKCQPGDEFRSSQNEFLRVQLGNKLSVQ